MATVPEGYVALDFVGFTDKGTYSPDATYMQNDLVHLDNSIWKCRVDQTRGILPGDNDNWEIFIRSTSELKGTTASDVNGLLGTAGANVDAQMLIDAITDRVMNQLLAKSQLVTNLLATEPGNPLDSTMGKVLKDEVDSLTNNLQGMKLCCGNVNVPANGDADVKFPSDFFTTRPYIVVTVKGTVDGRTARIQQGTDSATGFQIHAESNDSSTVTCNWIAMGE